MTYKILEVNEEKKWIKIEVELPDGSLYVKRMMIDLSPVVFSDEDIDISQRGHLEQFKNLDKWERPENLTSLENINRQVAEWYKNYTNALEKEKKMDTSVVVNKTITV